MTDNEKQIHKYIDEKKELQKLVLGIIEKSDTDVETDIQSLMSYLDIHQYRENKKEIEHFLHLILSISLNHYRQPNFFENIEKILTVSSTFYKPLFSNDELFRIFQQSKPILLILLKTKIIIIDEIIFKNLLSFSEMKEDERYYYFYPELNSFIKSGTIEEINDQNYKLTLNEDIEIFESNRQKFENESTICSLIRGDLIIDFIQYVNRKSISLSSQIKRSIFETNSKLIEKEPTLIEYAAFFGSIQIMRYLEINGVIMTPSIWLYAVHSNNPEVIVLLKEKQIEMDSKTFSEAIKCHHNDIANYIYQNIFNTFTNIIDFNEEDISSIYSSDNYEFFSYEIDGNKIFFDLCKNKYYELVDFHLASKNEEVNIINIGDALKNNELDIAYQLLMPFDCISRYISRYIYKDEITKIALPSTIKTISNNAFYKCTKLKQIIIPSSITSIGDNVFYGCISLTQISIPSSVTSIGENTFYECSSLTQITISSSMTSIKNSLFRSCSSLEQISIPSSVTSIENYAFNECLSLSQVSISSFVTLIGDFAFYGCSLLTQIVIPKSVTSIGPNAIRECSSLTQVSFEAPSSLKIICDFAFFGCSSLSQITLPSSLTSIENYVFDGCVSLLQIAILSPSISIGDHTFYGCNSLMQILIPFSIDKNNHDISSSTNIEIINK